MGTTVTGKMQYALTRDSNTFHKNLNLFYPPLKGLHSFRKMSVLEYLEDFAVLSPYPTWTDVFYSDFQTVKQEYKDADNTFDALTVSSKTTPSEIFTFLLRLVRRRLNEH